MKDNKYINLPELKVFFKVYGNMYSNPNEVDIHLTGLLSVSTYIWDKSPVKFTLNVEFEEDDPLLGEKMNLRTATDLDRINEAELWKHYLEGDGYVFADLDELLDTTLEFRIKDGKTIIESYKGDFKDQVEEVWDNVDSFRDYVRNNIQKLYITAENFNTFSV